MKNKELTYSYKLKNNILIQYKLKNNKKIDEIALTPQIDEYKILVEEEALTIYLSEYCSQMYSNPIFSESNLEYLKIIFDDTELKNPLNMKLKSVSLYENGIFVSYPEIDIITSNFFNKLVGIMICLI